MAAHERNIEAYDDEKIQLPDFLLADLYKSSLVEFESSATISAEPSEKQIVKSVDINISEDKISTNAIKYLGENRKGIVIIVNQPDAVFLLDEDLTFLTNILKACDLTLRDIAIINLSNAECTHDKIKEELGAKTILLFDVEPSAIKLPFMIPVFQVQQYSGCTIMIAPPLFLLNKSDSQGKLLKTKLWLSLKTIFNV